MNLITSSAESVCKKNRRAKGSTNWGNGAFTKEAVYKTYQLLAKHAVACRVDEASFRRNFLAIRQTFLLCVGSTS